jgi:hypothetical protein
VLVVDWKWPRLAHQFSVGEHLASFAVIAFQIPTISRKTQVETYRMADARGSELFVFRTKYRATSATDALTTAAMA